MDDYARPSDDPFAPLAVTQVISAGSKPDDWRPILPAPGEPPSTRRLPKLGASTAVWIYRDPKGAPLFAVYRFESPGKPKEILPLCYGELNGQLGWHWRSAPAPRPLYGLDRLAARPSAPVVTVEGEKAADAAALLFPNRVAVTWPGGAKAIERVDWTPLYDRENNALWPDNDDVGRSAAAAIAALLAKGEAAPVRIVGVPRDWPDGWDLADDLPPGTSAKTLRTMLDEARPMVPDAPIPVGFLLRTMGLFAVPVDGDPYRVCAPLSVEAVTSDGRGSAYGRLLTWRDMDGARHEWAMPATLLAGDGGELRSHLLDQGLELEPGRRQREALLRFIGGAKPAARVRVVSRLGWHDTPAGSTFVLPSGSIGATGDLRVMLQTERTDAMPPVATSGDLASWQQHVGAVCRGNSRLMFAVSAAFAPPLLRLLDIEGGGLHLRGKSSSGKTKALAAAGSVWGGGGLNGWTRRWRATDNGLEAIAAGHNDLLLCLDEMGEAAPETVAASAYSLANGGGKARAGRDGGARKAAEWRLMFLSTGEVGLAARLADSRGGLKRIMAGQQVRVLDIPADAGAGMGMFEDLHGAADGAAFAACIGTATRAYYGTAGRAYLTRLAADLEALTAAAGDAMRAFTAKHVPKDADGQVWRAGERFALAAAAGELATVLGVVPWQRNDAIKSAARCFMDWLATRDGGCGAAEDAAAMAAVRYFIGANASRFEDGDLKEGDARPVPNRAGWRKQFGSERLYCILPETWKREVVPGLDPMEAARAVDRSGCLVRQGDRLQTMQRIEGLPKPIRLYSIRPSILAGDAPSFTC